MESPHHLKLCKKFNVNDNETSSGGRKDEEIDGVKNKDKDEVEDKDKDKNKNTGSSQSDVDVKLEGVKRIHVDSD